MANYNADIRVGITGKTQLNALERQLGRINKDLNQINKNLKAQTLTINTKGATRALDQLDQKIRRLSRNVNIGINEKERKRSTNTVIASDSAGPAALGLRVARQRYEVQQKQTTELKSQSAALETQKKLSSQIEQIDNEILEGRTNLNKLNKTLPEQAGKRSFKETLDQLDQAGLLTRKLSKDFGNLKQRVEDLGPADAGKEFKRFFDAIPDRIKNSLGKAEDATRSSVQKQTNALKALADRRAQLVARSVRAEIAGENRITENTQRELQERQAAFDAYWTRRQRRNDRALQAEALRQKKQRGKQLKQGAFGAGALALSGVPGLGGAAQGALIGSVAGPAGAIAGAAVGGLAELTGATAQYANAAAKAAAEQEKFNTALRGITSGDDYQKALEDISELSEQFIQDIGTTTEQFTKLTAATTANGISVDETAEVYRGLAAANLALGGNAERLQGILLATGQVFSKGKVQAEELRGQIGERLPGAFALFAKSVGKTPAELDKALEKGEVTVEDFVKFTKSLFEQYGENAKIIRDGPANAGARLEKALGDLQRNIGKLLAPIGAAFQDTFTAITKAINVAIEALNRFLGIGTENALAKVNQKLEAAGERLQNVKPGRKSFVNQQITKFVGRAETTERSAKGHRRTAYETKVNQPRRLQNRWQQVRPPRHHRRTAGSYRLAANPS